MCGICTSVALAEQTALKGWTEKSCHPHTRLETRLGEVGNKVRRGQGSKGVCNMKWRCRPRLWKASSSKFSLMFASERRNFRLMGLVRSGGGRKLHRETNPNGDKQRKT
ncbi:hypothetical protein B0T16DRAFT_131578 [Cercophora newfieldiana]|uniref:Uncharacterized protein n=1 Tax=Cercophora newfieldiana TaxID=92897 RepID=A0AA40CUH0_9PEZI|nr:hypothetical protein B0T16DRAFT_131578 [Cercophora newfieldiana]